MQGGFVAGLEIPKPSALNPAIFKISSGNSKRTDPEALRAKHEHCMLGSLWFRVLGFGFRVRDITPIMENQLEKNTEHAMEARGEMGNSRGVPESHYVPIAGFLL